MSESKEEFLRKYPSKHRIRFRSRSESNVYAECENEECSLTFKIHIKTMQPDRFTRFCPTTYDELPERIPVKEWHEIKLPIPKLPRSVTIVMWRFKKSHHPSETEVHGFLSILKPTAVYVPKLKTYYNLINFEAWREL